MTGRRAGRLEHDGVAGDDGRGGHAGHDRAREVPRRDDDADAQRDVVQLGLVVRLGIGRMRLAQPQHLAAVELQEVDRLRGVGVGLDPRLAGFEHHQRAELVLALAHDLCRMEQVTGPLRIWNALPVLERPGRFAHCAVGQLRRRLADPADHLAKVRAGLRLSSTSSVKIFSPPMMSGYARPKVVSYLVERGLKRLLRLPPR